MRSHCVMTRAGLEFSEIFVLFPSTADCMDWKSAFVDVDRAIETLEGTSFSQSPDIWPELMGVREFGEFGNSREFLSARGLMGVWVFAVKNRVAPQ